MESARCELFGTAWHACSKRIPISPRLYFLSFSSSTALFSFSLSLCLSIYLFLSFCRSLRAISSPSLFSERTKYRKTLSSLDDTRIFGKPPTRDLGNHRDEKDEHARATSTGTLRRRKLGANNGKSVLPQTTPVAETNAGVGIENAVRSDVGAPRVCVLCRWQRIYDFLLKINMYILYIWNLSVPLLCVHLGRFLLRDSNINEGFLLTNLKSICFFFFLAKMKDYL